MVRPDSQPTETPAEAEDRPAGEGRSRGPVMHVATRSMSVDDFVVRFSGLASEEALVLPAIRELPIGTEARFAVHLQDRSVVMRGRCRVTECKPVSAPAGEGTNPGARRVMVRVALLEMDEESRAVHQRMLALKAAPVPAIDRGSGGPSSGERSSGGAVPVPVFGGDTERAIDAPPLEEIRSLRPRIPTPRLGGRAGRSRPPPPPVELRAPRSPYTLPANPLSELPIEDLSSLVEETLNEDPSGAAAAPPAATNDAAPSEAAAAPPSERVQEASAPRGRARGRVVLVGLLCTAIGVTVGWALRPAPAPRAPARPTATAPAQPTPPVAAPLAGLPAPVEPPAANAAPAPAAAAAPSPAAPPAPAGECVARIVTEPADVKVIWGDRLLGRSPLEAIAIPCGPSRVTLERERYQMVARDVTAEPGTRVEVSEKLSRPPASLTIESSPPGAAISINGRASGVTPARLELLRYERVSIRVTLSGHAPFEQTIYLKAAETKIDARLTAAPTP